MARLFLGAQFIHLKEVDSTNEFAQRLLVDQPLEGTVITTDVQTTGRGQAGTRWEAAAGQNVLMSTILYPKALLAREAFVLGQLTALAVWQAIHAIYPDADLHIKWPNDILLDGQKVAGILIENQLRGSNVESSIIGIGINVNQAIFPPGFGNPTSLFLYSGQHLEREAFKEQVLDKLEAAYLRLRRHGPTSFKRDFDARMYSYRAKTLLEFDGQQVHCQILGTDAQGHLWVELPDGSERTFAHKEVRWIL